MLRRRFMQAMAALGFGAGVAGADAGESLDEFMHPSWARGTGGGPRAGDNLCREVEGAERLAILVGGYDYAGPMRTSGRSVVDVPEALLAMVTWPVWIWKRRPAERFLFVQPDIGDAFAGWQKRMDLLGAVRLEGVSKGAIPRGMAESKITVWRDGIRSLGDLWSGQMAAEWRHDGGTLESSGWEADALAVWDNGEPAHYVREFLQSRKEVPAVVVTLARNRRMMQDLGFKVVG